MTKKVAVFLTANFETIEALAPVDLMRRADLEVTTVSLDQEQQVTSHQGVTVTADKKLAEVNLLDFDALFLPGGGLDEQKYFAQEAVLREFAAREDKLLAAICMAPTVLARLGLLEGKQATCYPAMKDYLTANGSTYNDVNALYHAQENILLGRAPGSGLDFGLALVEVLLGTEKARTIAEQAVYPFTSVK